MTRIIVTKRSYDHHARIEGFPETYGFGVSVESAVRSVVRGYPQLISDEIEVIYELPNDFLEALSCRSLRKS